VVCGVDMGCVKDYCVAIVLFYRSVVRGKEVGVAKYMLMWEGARIGIGACVVPISTTLKWAGDWQQWLLGPQRRKSSPPNCSVNGTAGPLGGQPAACGAGERQTCEPLGEICSKSLKIPRVPPSAPGLFFHILLDCPYDRLSTS